MGRKVAGVLSYLFHPVFYPPLLLVFYLTDNPVDFGLSTPLEDTVLILQTVITCTLLPLAAVFVMRRMKMISSFQMEDRMERIGPYIAMMIFLIWYYLSVDLYGVAPIFRIYILGSIISLISVFIINLFSKVSLHAAGISGVLINLMISFLYFENHDFLFRWGDRYFSIGYPVILGVISIILFIVLLSRFYLKKHTPAELAGGLLLGLFGQIVALKLIYII